MAFTTIGMTKPEGMFRIGGVPICYSNEFMFGSMPYGFSCVPIVQAQDGSYQLAHVEEMPQGESQVELPQVEVEEAPKIMEVLNGKEGEEWALVPRKRAREVAKSPRRYHTPPRRAATKKVYKQVPSNGRTIWKVRKAYQKELDARPLIPVSNPFAPLRLVKENSPKAQLKTLDEFPAEYQAKFRGRSPKARKSVKDRLVFPRAPVHERLGPKGAKEKASTSIKERLGPKVQGKSNTPVKERLGQMVKGKGIKKMWVPKEKVTLKVEVSNPEPLNKKRRTVWREKVPIVHARVNMIEIDEEFEMHAFVHMVGVGKDNASTSEPQEKRKKKDENSSSHDEYHSENENEKDDSREQDGEDEGWWAQGETNRLKSVIEKNEKEMEKMRKEKEKGKRIMKKMIKFLGEKNLLEELDGLGSSSSEEERPKRRVSKDERGKKSVSLQMKRRKGHEGSHQKKEKRVEDVTIHPMKRMKSVEGVPQEKEKRETSIPLMKMKYMGQILELV